MKKEPLVSVIIPTYNRAGKIGDAIRSALCQNYTNFEVLVIDDGSIDNTKDVVLKFPNVRYIKQIHAGQASARNNGLRNSAGSIIANLDSDDIWEPDFLKHCVQKLEEDCLDFVFANWAQQAKEGSDWDFLLNDPFLTPYFDRIQNGWAELESNDLRDLYLQACPSPSSSVVLRKSSIGYGWDEKINIGDDWALYIDMILSKKCRAAFTLHKLWRKRIDSINIFDGRTRSEVLELLYNADLARILERHKEKLSRNEVKKLTKVHTYSLIELAKHKIIREFNLKRSLSLFSKACSINTIFSLQAIPLVIFNGVANKIKPTEFHKYENLNERAGNGKEAII